MGRKRTILAEVADWALGLQASQIPETVTEKARCQLLSVLASVYGGSSLEASQAIRKGVRAMYRGTGASLLASGERSTPEGAVLVNASMSMAHDFDDYLFMGHTGHSAVLVPLALGEAMDLDVADLLLCQVMANEIAGRLGASAVLGPLNGQMWGFIHLAAAAAVAGRMLGLTPAQLEHGLAVALAQPPYPSQLGFFGSGAKLLTASWPSLLGMQGARLAAHGLTGPVRILDEDRGFYDTFSFHPLRGVWGDLGRHWVTETLAIKAYPGCAYVDAALDGLEEVLARIRDERGGEPAPDEIEGVEVRATALTCEMERLSESHLGQGLHPVSITFSARYSLAWRLLRGALRPEEMTEQGIRRLEAPLHQLATRITVVPDARLNRRLVQGLVDRGGLRVVLSELGVKGLLSVARKAARQYRIEEHLLSSSRWKESVESFLPRRLPTAESLSRLVPALRRQRGESRRRPFTLRDVDLTGFAFPFGARVELRLADGRRYVAERAVPHGAPGDREGDLAVLAEEKFRSQARGVLGEERAEEALGWLRKLPLDRKIREGVPLLTRRKRARAPRTRARNVDG